MSTEGDRGTAVISDLHLGSRFRMDLLRRPAVRARLTAALEGIDQLILLGDAFELRDRPLADAMAAAKPFLEEVGAALHGGRVVLVPGNHDHRLAWEALGLRERRRRRELDLVEEVAPGRHGALAAVRAALGTDLVVAYPGFEIADGVWATHGHYLDAFSAAPTLECLMSAVLQAPRRRHGTGMRRPADFEAALWPTYALFYAIAQHRRLQAAADAGKRAVRAVETALGARDAEHGGADGAAPMRLRLGGGRLGAAPGELRRPGLLPFGRVLDLLRVEADHVLFGHTHRTGPVQGDDPAWWRTEPGTRLWNTGSWVYEPAYIGPQGTGSPYWPGTITVVQPGRAPRVRRLLAAAEVAATS